MREYIFDAVIISNQRVNSGYIEFPYDVFTEFGKKGQVKVKVYFDGFEYRGSLVKMGTPCHIIGLNTKVREAINKKQGDTVHVVLTQDTDERIIDIPDDFDLVMLENQAVKLFFENLSFTNRKEYLEWITSAKKPETRAIRISKSIVMLKTGKRNPSEK